MNFPDPTQPQLGKVTIGIENGGWADKRTGPSKRSERKRLLKEARDDLNRCNKEL